jgi:hypothetical protein
MMNISEARVGMKVFFGRINGEQTLGEIVKVNAKCAKIRQLEQRGVNAAGTIWRVPYYFVSSAEGQMSGLGTSPEVDRFRRAFLTDDPIVHDQIRAAILQTMHKSICGRCLNEKTVGHACLMEG